MINTTDEIILLTTDPTKLHQACIEAINETCLLYRRTYDPSGIHISDIPSASKNCTYKGLTFPTFMNMDQPFDNKWIDSAFKCSIAEGTDVDGVFVSQALGHKSILPSTLAKLCVTGFRTVLLYLWSKKHLLLPMSFPLPRRRIGNKLVEFATEFYTEVLAFFRRPFCGSVLNQPDIIIHMSGTSAQNLNWYGYKPVLGSDWHSASDVSIDDLNSLNIFLAGQRKKKDGESGKVYSISAQIIAVPLLSAFPTDVSFSASDITTFPVNYVTLDVIQKETDVTINPAFAEQKKIWVAAEKLFIDHKRRSKVKSIRTINHCIGVLNKYIFEELPKTGHEPPFPSDFNHEYISCENDIPSVIEFLSTQAAVNTIRQMFEYFEDQQHRHDFLKNFRNPITKTDIPLGASRRTTSKSVFKLSIFRNFLAFVSTLQVLTCTLFHLLHSKSNDPEFHKRFLDDMADGVINIADWCECPTVRYMDPRNGLKTYRIQWIPATLLQTDKYYLTSSPTVKVRVPRPHAITVTMVVIHTGLRAITARWLDRARHLETPRPDPDDLVYSMYVSTDKVNGPWERPTLTSVYAMLDEFIKIQDHFEENNPALILDYDHFADSPFDPINPMFQIPGKDDVLSEHVLAKFYKTLMYSFNLHLKAQGIPTIDKLPYGLRELDFDKTSDFVAAYKVRKEFKTEYTPHGMRASVISSHSPFLTPELIGQHISGQKSVATVGYYTKLDSEFLNEVSQLGIVHPSSLMKNINAVFRPDDQTLPTWLTEPKDLDRKLHDLGAIALSADAPLSGRLINLTDITTLRFDFTHVCKKGQVCSPDVIETIGAFSCGRCSSSVKTIHHLPAILAKCRFLGRRADEIKEQLLVTAKITDNERVLRELEMRLEQDCAELSAWIASAEILTSNKERLKNDSVIYRSEILSSQVSHLKPASDQLSQLLLASIDADQYPEFLDDSLQRKIRELATRLMVYKGDISGVLDIPSGPRLPSYFRGIVGSICLAANIALEDLSSLLTGDIETQISLQDILKKIGG